MAQKAKELILNSISHEIRNPITAIVGVAKLLEKKESLSEEEQKLIKGLSSASMMLLNLVNNSLYIGKKEAGLLQFPFSNFSINNLLNSVLLTLSFQAIEKGISLKVNKNLHNDIYEGDELKLTQVLLNLVGNAIKFTNKGEVVVDVLEKNNALTFLIKDTGIGMNKQELSNAFMPFKQFQNNSNNSQIGSGLGLSICKSIVESQGGIISLDSDINKGTTVSFRLPYKKVKSTSENLYKEPIIEPNLLLGLKVLIIEDSHFNQLYLKHLIQSWNGEVITAKTGKEAKKKIDSTFFDLILLDLELPDINGKEIARYIKVKSKVNDQTPIIVLSANPKDESIKELNSELFSAYLQKPFKSEELYSLVFTTLKTEKTIKYLNLKEIKSIIGDNETLLKDLIKSFIDDYPQVLKKLKNSIKELNLEEFEACLHVLKSTLGYFNLLEQIELLSSIILEIKEDNKELAFKKIAIFENQLMCVMYEMNQLIN